MYRFGIDVSKCGIYKITNVINGNTYIGSAVNLHRRMRDHRRALVCNRHRNAHLQSSWNKYGADSFTFEVVENCEKELAVEREQFYMDLLKPKYNIAPVAGNSLGVKHTDESKQRMSEAHIGCKHTEEARKRMSEMKIGELNPNFGKHVLHSEEHKQKISEAHKGMKFTKEHIANIGLSKRGNTFRRGSKSSDETREKLRLSHLGHVISEETRAKMSASQKANPNNPGRFGMRNDGK